MACTYEPIDNSKNPLNIKGSISKGKLAAEIYKKYSKLDLKFPKKETTIQNHSEFEAMSDKEKVDYVAGRAKSLSKNGTPKSDLVTKIGKELPDGYGKIINSGVGKYLSAPYNYIFETGNFKISAIAKRLKAFVKDTGDSIFDAYNKSLIENTAEYDATSHIALLSVSEAIVDNAIKNDTLKELIEDTKNPLINMSSPLKAAIGLMAMNKVSPTYTAALLDGDAVTAAKYQYIIDNAKANSMSAGRTIGIMGHISTSMWAPYVETLLAYDKIKEQAFKGNPFLEDNINKIQKETLSDIKKGQKNAKESIDDIADKVVGKRKKQNKDKSTSLDIKVIKAQLKDELLAHRAEYLKNKGRTLNSTIDPALVDYGVAVMKSYVKAGVKITGKTLAKLFIDDLGFGISDEEAKLLTEYAEDLIQENDLNKSIDKLKARINDLNNKIHYAKTNDAIYKPESRAKIEKEISDIEKQLLKEINDLNNLYKAEKDRIRAKNNTEKRIEALQTTLSKSKEHLDNIINGVETIVENTTKAVKELTQEEKDLNAEIKKINEEIKTHPTTVLKSTLAKLQKEVLRVSENVAYSTNVKAKAEYDLGLYTEQQQDIIAQIKEQKELIKEYKESNSEDSKFNALERQLNEEYQKNTEIANGAYEATAKNVAEAKKESERITEIRKQIADAKQSGKSMDQLNKLKNDLAYYENNIIPTRKKREVKEKELSSKNKELKNSIEDTKKLIKAEKDRIRAESFNPLAEKGKAIKKRVTSDVIGSSNEAQDFANRVSRLLGQRTKKTSKTPLTKDEQLEKVLDDINFIAENIEAFDAVIKDAIAEVDADTSLTDVQKEAYKQEIENKYGNIIKNPISNNTIDDYIKKSLRAFGQSLSNIATMDSKVKKQLHDSLVKDLMDVVPEEQAKQITEDFTRQFNDLVAAEGVKSLKGKLESLKNKDGKKIKASRIKYVNKAIYDIIAKQGFILDEQLDGLLLHALDVPALSIENKGLLSSAAEELSRLPEGIFSDLYKPAFNKLVDKIKREEQRRVDYNGNAEARWYNRVNSVSFAKGWMTAVVKGFISGPHTLVLAAFSTAIKQIGAINDVLLNANSQDSIGLDKGTAKYVGKSFNPVLYAKAIGIYLKEIAKHKNEISSLISDTYKTGFNSMESSVEANDATNFFTRNAGTLALPKTWSVTNTAKFAYNLGMIAPILSNRTLISIDVMNRAGMTDFFANSDLLRELEIAGLNNADIKVVEGIQKAIDNFKEMKEESLSIAKQEYQELIDGGFKIPESYVYVRQYELMAEYGEYHEAIDNATKTIRRATEQADVEGSLGSFAKLTEAPKGALISAPLFLFQRTMLNTINHGVDYIPPVGLFRAIRGKSFISLFKNKDKLLPSDQYSMNRRKQSLVRAVNMTVFASMYLYAHQDDDEDDTEGEKVFREVLRQMLPIWIEGRGYGEDYKYKYNKKNTIANKEIEAELQKKFYTANIGFGDKDSPFRFNIPLNFLPTGLAFAAISEYENFRKYGKEKLSDADLATMVISNAAYDVFNSVLGNVFGDIKTKRAGDMLASFSSQLIPGFQAVYKDLVKSYGVVAGKSQQESYIKDEFADQKNNILHSMYLTVTNNTPLMFNNNKAYDSFGDEILINPASATLSTTYTLVKNLLGDIPDKDKQKLYSLYNRGVNFAFDVKASPVLNEMSDKQYKEYIELYPEQAITINSNYQLSAKKLYKAIILEKGVYSALSDPKISKEDKQAIVAEAQKMAIKKTKDVFSKDLNEKQIQYLLDEETKKINKENFLIGLGLKEE